MSDTESDAKLGADDADPSPVDDADATPEETRRLGFDVWVPREYSIYRHVLVQRATGERGSTLGQMVSQGKHRALVLYLLLIAWWPWLQKWETPMSGDTWLRALEATGPAAGRGLTWSASSLSRTFAELEALNLIAPRARKKRYLHVVPLREDGSGDLYTAPTGSARDPYFTLPHTFWTNQLFATLRLPGLAVLLIILKETNGADDVWLSRTNMTKWYGISDRTITRGIAELRTAKLLDSRPVRVKAPMAPGGSTERLRYWLLHEYGRADREAQRAAAQAARTKASAPDTGAGDEA